MAFLENCLSNQIKQGRSWALLLGEQHTWARMDISSHLMNQSGCITWERTSNLFSTLTALQWQPALEMMRTLFNSTALLCAGRGNTSRVKCCCLMVSFHLSELKNGPLLLLWVTGLLRVFTDLYTGPGVLTNPEEIFKRLPQRYSRRKKIRARS